MKYHRPVYCISDFQQELALQLPLIKSRAFPRVHVRELLFHAFLSEYYPPSPFLREGKDKGQINDALNYQYIYIYIYIYNDKSVVDNIHGLIDPSLIGLMMIPVGEQIA